MSEEESTMRVLSGLLVVLLVLILLVLTTVRFVPPGTSSQAADLERLIVNQTRLSNELQEFKQEFQEYQEEMKRVLDGIKIVGHSHPPALSPAKRPVPIFSR